MRPNADYVRVGEVRHTGGGPTFGQWILLILIVFGMYVGYREYKERQLKAEIQAAITEATIADGQRYVQTMRQLQGR